MFNADLQYVPTPEAGFPARLHSFGFKRGVVQLPVPDPGAVHQLFLHKTPGTHPAPYWSKLWAAAPGLCSYLDNNEHLLAGRKVLELAGGLGLPSLLAAMYSSEVLCTDHSADAVAWARYAAALNGLHHVRHALVDWNHLPEPIACDTLLLSDVNYEPEAFDTLFNLVFTYIGQGTTIVLSTPQRLVAKPFINRLLPWCRRSETENVILDGASNPVSVFELCKQPK